MGQSQQLPSGAPGTPGSPSPKHSALLPLPRAPAPPVPAPGAPAPSVPPPLPGSPAPRVPLPVPPAPPVPPPVPPAPPVPPPLPVAPPVLPPPRDALMPAPHRSKLRTFHWTVIPAERVRGRPSVWTASSQHDHTPLDVEHLEELFGEQPGWGPRGPLLLGRPQGQVSLLDSKKILNLEIFLKQFKRPVQQIVADLRAGAGALYGAEKLLELCKMLPDTDEQVKKLRAFQGSWRQLSDAETFSLLLVGVPSYARRLELLVLKEEFFPQLNSLKSSIQILTEAARELLGCEELHVVIRLVLRAGNYMNMGGYAGHAAGFRMASLLRLADTKANKPGVDLLHFVAMDPGAGGGVGAAGPGGAPGGGPRQPDGAGPGAAGALPAAGASRAGRGAGGAGAAAPGHGRAARLLLRGRGAVLPAGGVCRAARLRGALPDGRAGEPGAGAGRAAPAAAGATAAGEAPLHRHVLGAGAGAARCKAQFPVDAHAPAVPPEPRPTGSPHRALRQPGLGGRGVPRLGGPAGALGQGGWPEAPEPAPHARHPPSPPRAPGLPGPSACPPTRAPCHPCGQERGPHVLAP
ncbi:FH2 domain-containing protein 1-like isoform X7 [Chrysemys picta bellii]|uniref:FH2 domain-containing protein 1-like isoform X7 n=1 Tax=Chrysemys picta bellii TaxID=8478 RepID=UPI0032B19414